MTRRRQRGVNSRGMLVQSAAGATGRRLNVVLPLDLYERLERAAYGTTVTEIVTRALDTALRPRRAPIATKNEGTDR